MMSEILNYIGIDIYYLIILISIMAISIGGTMIHKKALPVLWGTILTAILYYNYSILYPILTGWVNLQQYSIFYIIGALFSITWILILIMAFKNIYENGEVIN